MQLCFKTILKKKKEREFEKRSFIYKTRTKDDKNEREKRRRRKGSIQQAARTRALLARGCDAVLPIAPLPLLPDKKERKAYETSGGGGGGGIEVGKG